MKNEHIMRIGKTRKNIIIFKNKEGEYQNGVVYEGASLEFSKDVLTKFLMDEGFALTEEQKEVFLSSGYLKIQEEDNGYEIIGSPINHYSLQK